VNFTSKTKSSKRTKGQRANTKTYCKETCFQEIIKFQKKIREEIKELKTTNKNINSEQRFSYEERMITSFLVTFCKSEKLKHISIEKTC
jgi:hypothetical protein